MSELGGRVVVASGLGLFTLCGEAALSELPAGSAAARSLHRAVCSAPSVRWELQGRASSETLRTLDTKSFYFSLLQAAPTHRQTKKFWEKLLAEPDSNTIAGLLQCRVLRETSADALRTKILLQQNIAGGLSPPPPFTPTYTSVKCENWMTFSEMLSEFVKKEKRHGYNVFLSI